MVGLYIEKPTEDMSTKIALFNDQGKPTFICKAMIVAEIACDIAISYAAFKVFKAICRR